MEKQFCYFLHNFACTHSLYDQVFILLEKWKRCSYKLPHFNAYNDIVHNHQRIRKEISCSSAMRLMNCCIYSMESTLYSATEKEWTVNPCNNVGGSQMNKVKQNYPNSKDYVITVVWHFCKGKKPNQTNNNNKKQNRTTLQG